MKRFTPIAMLLVSSVALAADTYDQFGIKTFAPTTSGGREWFLPRTTLSTNPDTFDENMTVANVPVDCGEYKANGQVRLSIISPDGGAWWRNVEMTGYLKLVRTLDGGPTGQEPHWEFQVRGERHNGLAADQSDINFGVGAPTGTATWPGYPYATGAINPRCLGTAYHGNVYPNGDYHVEKEISHTDGYAGNRSSGNVAIVDGGYFGFKLLIRNRLDAGTVNMVTYIDANGDGGWVAASSVTDVGRWDANTNTIDSCNKTPYGYSTHEIITWAGPWATFRSDNIVTTFKWLSIREVDPLP
jgi:hypothetical protein